ncbi:hypothetical protein FD13_GL001963 [Levilactobacillus senmaizukei DSM 21775 = NBRC 103853]|uniref:DNA alkylation repair enzyme n=2 Tax=Levilactobacillus senmaizukei TaxID=431273 RepID=A0A0R2DE48_9LACO|nr:hypothetical protein FD13_GL001963 [Levilactobacillus senmaizukei DSM 21775 = NBRC 103853]
MMDLMLTEWTATTYAEFLTDLQTQAKPEAGQRVKKIVVTDYPVLGISMRELKIMGTEIAKGNPNEFLRLAGVEFYEVIIIRGYVLGQLKVDCQTFERYLASYLATADCWAICDMAIHFKQVKRYPDEFLQVIKTYLAKDNPWLQRTGLVFLLKFYLDVAHWQAAIQLGLAVRSPNYYVQMGQAWLLATAYRTHEDTVIQKLKAGTSLEVA